MKYAIFICGSAGSGKSTLTAALLEHYQVIKRTAHAINLDPSVLHLPYQPAADIRSLITS